jgi:sigma-B regulation protein RsbU (phosphoserine phosphatase)
MSRSITTRLIVLLTAVLAAIFAAGMLIDYRLSRAEILERLQLQSEDTIQSAITDMENWLEAVEGATLFMARILEQRDYSRPGLEQMLKDIVQNNEDIFGAAIALNPELAGNPLGFAPYYFHRDGILTYADLAAEQNNYQRQAWFKDTVSAGRPTWVEPYFDAGGGEVLMTTFGVPVYRVDDNDGRYLYAVVTADVSLAELRSYLRRLRLGDQGSAILLSRTGIILGTRNQDNILRHYSEVLPDNMDLDSWRTMFQTALAGQVVSEQLQCPDVPGRCSLRLGALRSTGWPVGIIYSEQEILAPLRAFQVKTLLLGIVTLLLMALAVYWVTRRLTRPLTALADATGALARGDLNAPLPTPQGKDEVARLVQSFSTMQRDLRQYIAELETETARRSRLDGELNAARSIQMSLLPGGGRVNKTLGEYALWAQVRPARSVGGDLYSYLVNGNQLWLAIGDVSDKGVPAALFMARAVSLIPQLAGTQDDPAQSMALLNDALCEGNDSCMFVTLFLGVLDLTSGMLHFASAGHTVPVLLREGVALPVEQQDGPALGLAPGLEFPVNTLCLQAGDRLVAYTDGIDEAFNAGREMFGRDRLVRCLQESWRETPASAGAAVLNAVDAFAGDVSQSDDIALLALERPVVATAGCDLSRGPRLTSRALDWLQQTLATQAIPAEVVGEMQLVLEEIVTNIDKYAGLAAEATIRVDIEASRTEVRLQVTDSGVSFDPLAEAHRAALGVDSTAAEVGGLGVHLITQLTDSQTYARQAGRNILRVTKHLTHPH